MSSAALRSTTLADALIPGTGIVRDALLTVGGTVLTAVAAQVTIPWQPVPFTLQTLSVMLCGLALGWRRGGVSQLLYLAAGAAGLPVFASLSSGLHVFVGPTAGYLFTYPFVAGLLGLLAERNWTKSILGTSAAMAIGDGITLLAGAAWLSLYIGWKGAVQHGIAPFIGAEVVKAVFVILALPSAWKLTRGSDPI
jgi:biotin transport system substrate-specific component